MNIATCIYVQRVYMCNVYVKIIKSNKNIKSQTQIKITNQNKNYKPK